MYRHGYSVIWVSKNVKKSFRGIAEDSASRLSKAIRLGVLEGESLPKTPVPKSPDFTYLSEGQQKIIKDLQEGADSEFGMGFYD